MTCNDGATGTLESIGFQDHSVSSEYDILGPPGTGKTRRAADLIRRDAARYGPDAILATSFSRTAAAELVTCSCQSALTESAHCTLIASQYLARQS